jgi:hypothetical protein
MQTRKESVSPPELLREITVLPCRNNMKQQKLGNTNTYHRIEFTNKRKEDRTMIENQVRKQL